MEKIEYYRHIFTNEIITSKEMGDHLFNESRRQGKIILTDNEWVQTDISDRYFRTYPNNIIYG